MNPMTLGDMRANGVGPLAAWWHYKLSTSFILLGVDNMIKKGLLPSP
jgi:hypothetical protein